jgi:hypothetical protein
MKGLLLAEWTKLRSVRRWAVTLAGAVLLTIGLSYLASTGNKTNINDDPNIIGGPNGGPVADRFTFVHWTVTGDVTVTVRVGSLDKPGGRTDRELGAENLRKLDDPSPFARPAAGIMIKDGTRQGSSYASVMLTAGAGVRMQWDFDADRAGSASRGSRWLRLARAGGTVTGYESPDGVTWTKVATASPRNLPATAEIGFYVSSPPEVYTRRGGGSSSLGLRETTATATFDNVAAGPWTAEQIGIVKTPEGDGDRGQVREAGGTVTVDGSGKVGPNPQDDDMVEMALIGVIGGLLALICVGSLFATSEYRRGMIRTTFAASPRRGRVLAAKAIVLGAVSFVIGLAGAVGSLLLAIPALRRQGFTAPAFPEPSLTDATVVRTVLLTAAFVAGVALVSLAIGMLLRHSAAAITLTVVLLILPLIVGMILPGSSPKWLMYTTLAGGLATQRAKPPTVTLAEPWALIGPWAGISVVAAWAVATLALAWWRLRTRDA